MLRHEELTEANGLLTSRASMATPSQTDFGFLLRTGVQHQARLPLTVFHFQLGKFKLGLHRSRHALTLHLCLMFTQRCSRARHAP